MPRLWSDTIEAHRREVRDVVMDSTAHLAWEHGPLNITMSQVAEQAGIGRATLYKYFASVEEILRAWHDRQISRHLAALDEIADRDAPPLRRLAEVLAAYAQIRRDRVTGHGHRRHGHEVAAFLHAGDDVAPAEKRLRGLVEGLLTEAVGQGQVRTDVPAGELAAFCLHALDAAADLPSKAATERLVGVVVDGVQARGDRVADQSAP